MRGTFGIKGNVPYFQIAQHSKSKDTMEAINLFLENLAKQQNLKTSLDLKFSFSKSINSKTGVLSYTVNDIDKLYYLLLPYFESLEFKTRKYTDFKFWAIALRIHKLGYFYSS